MTERPAPRTDYLVYPLSRFADHSKLWMSAACLLAGVGGRSGRRAALRGLVSVGATSTIANAIIKSVAQRRRPGPVQLDWLSRVAAVPTSSSFPSGHAASAAAFAVGASAELPVIGAPLALIAAAVGYSRVRTRVHYPADVLAGFVVGTAVALATRRLWPVAPHSPARVTPALACSYQRPSPYGAGLSIVVNSSAGADAHSPVDVLREALPAAEIIELDDPAHLDEALDGVALGATIGIVGGDGSINAAAEFALERGTPLAVIPGGTLNHFARDLGVSDVHSAVAAIRDGQVSAVDVGTISGKPFLNTASFGSYAELVDAREQLENRIGKWPALALALVRVLRHASPIAVLLDGIPTKVWMIFIGNCEYQPPGMAPGWRNRLDDGMLDIRYIDGEPRFSRIRLGAALLSGQLGRSKVYKRLVQPHLEVQSLEGPLRLARDGETFDGGTSALVSKLPGALAVYAPSR